MDNALYENNYFYIVKEEASIPWVKIFTKKPYKELSECDESTQKAILRAMLLVEKSMLSFYNPDKINIALFGNYVPHVHIHVMARYKEDSHFPESMWGVKQREGKLHLPSFERFAHFLKEALDTEFSL